MRLRRATSADIPTIAKWREERADWLNARGSDQWSDAGLTRAEFIARVTASVEARTTWIAETEAGVPVGTIGADSSADDGLWSTEELGSALVVHRMIVPLGSKGLGVGDFMLAKADEMAHAAGKRKLLLDAWNSNKGLHDYYRARGFRYTGTKEGHWTPSSTLFERPVSGH